MFSNRLSKPVAIGAIVVVVAAGAAGAIAAANSGTSNSAAASTTSTAAARGGGANARSGPATGGSLGTVNRASSSGFTLSTSAGQEVTVKLTSSTTYTDGKNPASAGAITNGETALVLGTTNSTTITAAQVIVQPPTGASGTSSQVVPFKSGAPSASKSVGQIPANYQQGSGTIVSGAAANQATEAALAAYPGGIVDRVVELSNGEYEVHNIGVNWPHHVFVNKDFQVVGAD